MYGYRLNRIISPSSSERTLPDRPVNATTPLPLSAYTGTYGNAGYGSITLCDPGASSFYCKNVLADFNAVDSVGSTPWPSPTDLPQLYAAWDRLWGSHIRLVHVEDNTFNASVTTLFPAGYGADKTPFETAEKDEYPGAVKFVVEQGKVIGLGLFEQMDGTVEWMSAWFHKV